MACALTAGIALDCIDDIGGIQNIYITELANKNTLTTTAGKITAFTLNTGKQFWSYAVDKEVAEFVETETLSEENLTVFYEQVLTFNIKGMTTAKRNELRLLVQNRVMVIFQDQAGLYWLMGETGAKKIGTNEARSGRAMGDLNGYNIALTSREVLPAKEVDSTLIATLLAPA